MSKVFRFIPIFVLSIILFGCSFDHKTGIWNNHPKHKTVNVELIKLSESQKKFQTELNPELIIDTEFNTLEESLRLLLQKMYDLDIIDKSVAQLEKN